MSEWIPIAAAWLAFLLAAAGYFTHIRALRTAAWIMAAAALLLMLLWGLLRTGGFLAA